MLVASGAAITIALSTVLSLASFGGAEIAGAAVHQAKSFLDLMHQRSPGKRTEAQLIKTKHKQHRVLAERSPEPQPIVVPAYVPDVGLVAPPLAVPASFFPQGPVLAQIPPPLFFVPPPGVAIVPPPPRQPPAPPGVPEPGTWMLLLAGFGLSGWMLRRDHRMKRISIG